MGKRFYKIIVAFILLLATAWAYGQEQPKKIRIEPAPIAPSFMPGNAWKAHFTSTPYTTIKNEVKPVFLKASYLPPTDTYTRQFGFFCRKELQFEKATKIQLRFRLGSINYCNVLEGK